MFQPIRLPIPSHTLRKYLGEIAWQTWEPIRCWKQGESMEKSRAMGPFFGWSPCFLVTIRCVSWATYPTRGVNKVLVATISACTHLSGLVLGSQCWPSRWFQIWLSLNSTWDDDPIWYFYMQTHTHTYIYIYSIYIYIVLYIYIYIVYITQTHTHTHIYIYIYMQIVNNLIYSTVIQ